MDHNDLEHISKTISDLQINNKMLINENNEQFKMNLQLQNRINSIINRLNQQQSQITKNIKTARLENNTDKNFKILREVMKINYNLDHLRSHLENLFESVQLARLNIIPKQILSVEELAFVSDILEKQNIIPTSIEQTYEFLDLSAFYNNSKLIFIVSIPRIENSTHVQFLLELLPISNKTLKLPASVALHNGNRTYFIREECRNIGKTRLCNLNNLIDFTGDTCYSNLLKGLSGNCTFTSCHQPQTIKRITDNHIVITDIHNIEINSNCGLTKRNLSGTYLIEFHNCSIVINGTEYYNAEMHKSEPTIVMSLDGLHINQQTLEIHNNIEEIHIRNRHQMDTITTEHKIQTYTSISMSSICLLLSIFTGLCWISKRRKQISLNIGTSTESDAKTKKRQCGTECNPTNRDDPFSKGGVVKIEPSWIPNTTLTNINRFVNTSSLPSSPSTIIATTTTTTPMTTTAHQLAQQPERSTPSHQISNISSLLPSNTK
ncbi:uncharacterized protein LOC135712347 [Ochlerotatus camptorhynchus]|uniref:uncharacterized protein LOC135712347 n=1 Tax=Ochlerotatus camptorhynchus TaxID=644619 RepID=UPI0031DF6D6F